MRSGRSFIGRRVPTWRSSIGMIARQSRIPASSSLVGLIPALDNGVKPSELSEIITHLAFYSGWANATSAVAVAKEVFVKRGIVSDQPTADDLLPVDEAASAQRAARVEQDAGPVAPGVVQYTTDLLFRDLWLWHPATGA